MASGGLLPAPPLCTGTAPLQPLTLWGIRSLVCHYRPESEATLSCRGADKTLSPQPLQSCRWGRGRHRGPVKSCQESSTQAGPVPVNEETSLARAAGLA